MDAWRPGAGWPGLAERRVDVWRLLTRALTPANLKTLDAALSEEERAEADRRTHRSARDELIVARGLTRKVLARCLGIDPRELRFERDDRGRPHLAGELLREPLDFNLSHTRGVVLLAARRTETGGERVGVDVEHMRRPVHWRALAERFFSAPDVRAINALPDERQLEGFFTCWTRKEALVKAQGTGIALAFGAFGVSADPDRPPVLDPANESAWHSEAWVLQDLPMETGYRACLAASAPVEAVRLWELDTTDSDFC
ncbi:MAG: 4'-phosphopantetheinyl transferase family protein [Gammaproteobacteria bacterium]